jgi:hypothetical protein
MQLVVTAAAVVDIKVKVKVTLEQAAKVQRGR